MKPLHILIILIVLQCIAIAVLTGLYIGARESYDGASEGHQRCAKDYSNALDTIEKALKQ